MFRGYLKEKRGSIVFNAFIKTTGTLLEISLPAILAYIIDNIIPQGDKNLLILWGLFMAVLAFLAWVLNILANRLASKVSTSIIFSLRRDLFAKAMSLSERQIDTISASSLESRMTSDTYTVHRMLRGGMTFGNRVLVLFFGGVIFTFILNWKLASILIILLVPIALIIRNIFKKGIPLFKKAQEALDELVQVIRESVRGIRVIKAFNKTDYEKERYARSDDIYKDSEISAMDTMAITRPVVDSILFSGLALILVIGYFMVEKGQTQTGVIIAFLSYFIQITMAMIGFTYVFNLFNRTMTSLERIQAVFDLEPDENQIEIDNPKDLPAKDPNVPEIEFRNVSFSYLGEKDDLHDISFKIYPGDQFGIMGPTGSGKTTVLKLLFRKYDPDEGQVLIRGVDIKELRIEDIKKLFGSAFQSDFLYSGSLRDNINFGRDLSDKQIIEATEDAQASEFISTKEEGLDFMLASKGVNLSGGQKQRVTLSRALAGHPEIMILDDSTSALDFKTEAKFRKAIDENYGDTTKIIIAQRLASLHDSEQILFLDDGKALGLGSHEELMENLGQYREIAQMQGGF